MRRGRGAAAALALALVGGTAQAAVTASLDSREIAADETVQLTVDHDGRTRDQPDLSPLQQDFDVLSTSRSTNVQIINGDMSSHTQTIITLSPKHAGRLVVPPLVWAGETTAPLTLTVTAPGAAGAQSSAEGTTAKPPVFVETITGRKDPFVQAAVSVTLRVFMAEQLYQGRLEFAGNNDVLVQQLGSDLNRTMERDGRQYEVVERHYLLFPQRSGQLVLPGAVLDGQVAQKARQDRFSTDPFADLLGAGGLLSAMKPIRVHGEPIELNVRPSPAGSGSGYWLPAEEVGLSSRWHPEGLQAHAGDPITLDLHLQALGLTAAQLPDVAALLTLPAGLKAYPDQAKLNNVGQGDTVLGSRDQSVALIADKPGEFELPELHLSWWDTKANQAREVVLPAARLTILPAAATSATGAAAAPRSAAAAPDVAPAAGRAPTTASGGVAQSAVPVNRWLIGVSAGFGALWIATLVAWWVSRRRGGEPRAAAVDRAPETALVDGAQARTAFHEACRRNDARAARRLLLGWAGTVWREHPPQGLNSLAERIGSEPITERLRDLDRACYGDAAWDGAALAAALRDLSAPPARGRGKVGEIAPLYP